MHTTALGFYLGAKDQTQVLMLAQQTTELSPQLLTPSLVTATSGIKQNGVGCSPLIQKEKCSLLRYYTVPLLWNDFRRQVLPNSKGSSDHSHHIKRMFPNAKLLISDDSV